MKNKLFWLGILALALVFGMTIIGCGPKGCPGGGLSGGAGKCQFSYDKADHELIQKTCTDSNCATRKEQLEFIANGPSNITSTTATCDCR